MCCLLSFTEKLIVDYKRDFRSGGAKKTKTLNAVTFKVISRLNV